MGASGLITWAPVDVMAGTTNIVQVRVIDNGLPSLSATQGFTVFVVSRPILSQPMLTSGNATLVWSAIAGTSRRVQYKPDLKLTNRSDLTGDVTAGDTNAPKIDTTVSGTTNRFYRIQVLP